MFQDLDRTIEALMRNQLPADVRDRLTISFATPDEDFPPAAVPTPAIDFFLYDVRENRELRTTEWLLERDELNRPRSQRRAPVRVDCSYLITAWIDRNAPSAALEEHRVLSEVTRVLLRHPTLPRELLQGSLRHPDAPVHDVDPPLPTTTLEPGRLQNPSDFWQVISKPKAMLHFTVTLGLDLYEVLPVHRVETKDMPLTPTTPDEIRTMRAQHQAELKESGR